MAYGRDDDANRRNRGLTSSNCLAFCKNKSSFPNPNTNCITHGSLSAVQCNGTLIDDVPVKFDICVNGM
jgi:hypothetical protein